MQDRCDCRRHIFGGSEGANHDVHVVLIIIHQLKELRGCRLLQLEVSDIPNNADHSQTVLVLRLKVVRLVRPYVLADGITPREILPGESLINDSLLWMRRKSSALDNRHTHRGEVPGCGGGAIDHLTILVGVTLNPKTPDALVVTKGQIVHGARCHYPGSRPDLFHQSAEELGTLRRQVVAVGEIDFQGERRG